MSGGHGLICYQISTNILCQTFLHKVRKHQVVFVQICILTQPKELQHTAEKHSSIQHLITRLFCSA